MSTVNFSVPAEIREAFDAAFAGENKSAVIARLMARAVGLTRLTAWTKPGQTRYFAASPRPIA